MNVNTMSVRWGGCQEKMRDTKIKEVGPYPSILRIGDIQRMVFEEQDSGPFYLPNNHRQMRKYGRPTGKWKVITKTKKKLKIELKEKGYVVRGHITKDKIEQLAKEHDIQLTCSVEVVEEGWLCRN